MRDVRGSGLGVGWVELPGVDQGGFVFAVVDLVAQAFGAFDDGADGGVDEASGVQAHGDAVADVVVGVVSSFFFGVTRESPSTSVVFGA
jgi:hypothetical protein